MTSLQAAGVRRLNAMMRQARDPLYVIDSLGRLVYVNEAWEAFIGLDADSVLGRQWIGGEDDPLWNRERSLTGSLAPPPEVLCGQPGGGVTIIPSVSGGPKRRRIEFSPYVDEKGQPLGWLATIRPENSPSNAPDSPSQRAHVELADTRERLRTRIGIERLVGKGSRHDRLLEQVKTAAASTAPVLLIGEAGTGRSLVASAIHNLGSSRHAPLIPLDFKAIPPETIETTLRDVLASSTPERIPSILLREALDLPRDQQAWLASVVHERRARILATTGVEPEVALREDRIREDFYFAITAFVVRLAPLRERLDELPLLAYAFLDDGHPGPSTSRFGIEPDAIQALREYDWPGNLPELRRVLVAARADCRDGLIRAGDLPASIRGASGGAYAPPPVAPSATPLDLWLTQLERKLIEQALHRARQNKSRAAELLGISRPRLYRRI